MAEGSTSSSGGFSVSTTELKDAGASMQAIINTLTEGVNQVNPGTPSAGSALECLKLTTDQLGPGSGPSIVGFQSDLASTLNSFISGLHAQVDDLLGELNQAVNNLNTSALNYNQAESNVKGFFFDIFGYVE